MLNFDQQLAAGTTWSDWLDDGIVRLFCPDSDHYYGLFRILCFGKMYGNAFCAGPYRKGGIFLIASGDDHTIFQQDCGAYSKPAVGRVARGCSIPGLL